jgi:hypothetical protein
MTPDRMEWDRFHTVMLSFVILNVVFLIVKQNVTMTVFMLNVVVLNESYLFPF